MCNFCKDIVCDGQDKYVSYSFKEGYRYKEAESGCPPFEYPLENNEIRTFLSHEGDAIFLSVGKVGAEKGIYFEVLNCPFCGRDLTKEVIC